MKTILQVEDDPNDVLFLQHAMKRAGLANPIRVASDGQEAIDYLQGVGKFADRDQFPFPSLVLLDLKLPDVMGLDVLKWIRQQSGMNLVVLLLTASKKESDIEAAYRLGANGFLAKPCEATQLQDMVKTMGEFWLTHNLLPKVFPRASGPRPPTNANEKRPCPGRVAEAARKVTWLEWTSSGGN